MFCNSEFQAPGLSDYDTKKVTNYDVYGSEQVPVAQEPQAPLWGNYDEYDSTNTTTANSFPTAEA